MTLLSRTLVKPHSLTGKTHIGPVFITQYGDIGSRPIGAFIFSFYVKMRICL